LPIILKVLVALMALLFLALALNFMLNPLAASAAFSILPEGAFGLNTVRGDLGGLFFGCALMLVVGLWRGEGVWFLAVAVLMGSIALGRLLGFALDGLVANNLPAFALELLFALALVGAYRRS
jgi:hypothetical protein